MRSRSFLQLLSFLRHQQQPGVGRSSWLEIIVMAFADSNENDPLEQVVIPLHAEEVSVGKRQVATGHVMVSTVTRSREELVEQLLQSERVEVDRVPVGKVIAKMPEVRTEDDTTIIPVVEEVVVLQRQLVLKEEVRVRRIRETQNHQERVVLRRQEAVITRAPENDNSAVAVAAPAQQEEQQTKKE
jgi:stress response protein YsnF